MRIIRPWILNSGFGTPPRGLGAINGDTQFGGTNYKLGSGVPSRIQTQKIISPHTFVGLQSKTYIFLMMVLKT